MTGSAAAPPSAPPLDLSPMSPQMAATALSAGNADSPAPWAPWHQFGAPQPAPAQFPNFMGSSGKSGSVDMSGSGIPGGSTSKMDIPVVQGAVNAMPQTWKQSRWWHPWQVQPGVTEEEFGTVLSNGARGGSAFSSTPNAIIPYDPFFKIYGSNATGAGIGGPFNNTIPITMPGGPGTGPPFSAAAADFPNSGVSNFPI